MSGILSDRKHYVSLIGYVPVLRLWEGDIYSVGSLRKN
jgi:hypothetical protein